MRELRLKYIIQMVSDIASRAKTDEQALTLAQKAVQEALKKSTTEAGLLERALLRMAAAGGRSTDQQAAYLARLALRYQDVRKAAEGAASAMQTVAKVGAGVGAAAYAIDRGTRAPMEYSLRLAHMANTAYADRDAAGRIAGKRTLNAAITAAVRTGGGSRDDAAGALDLLIASGEVSIGDAIKLLPTLMRSSTASGASAEELGGIALRGMQSFGIKLDQVPEALNMAFAGGQAGGFELRDMKKWLPQAMAAGRQSGLYGMEGLRRIIASMQASVITAGSKDEAGNNVVNLLAKINSQDTANDFKKLGIDLPGALAKERSKGVNSLDAFIGFVDKIASQDPQYMALKNKLAKGGTQGERAETMQAMADILQGKAVGKVIQDRQALMALVAEMNNRPYVKQVMDATRTNTSAIGTSFDVVAQEASFQRQQAANEAQIAGQEAFGRMTPALNAVYGTATGLAREFPVLTQNVMAAAGAAGVLATALGGGALVELVTGKGGKAAGGSVLRTLGVATAAAAGTGIAASFGGLLGLLKKFPVLSLANDLFFTSEYDLEVLRNADRMRAGYRGKGFDDPRRLDRRPAPALATLNLTDPGSLPGLGGDAGRGQLDVRVVVSDDRVTATPVLAKPMSIVRINPGNTNPAGYGDRP